MLPILPLKDIEILNLLINKGALRHGEIVNYLLPNHLEDYQRGESTPFSFKVIVSRGLSRLKGDGFIKQIGNRKSPYEITEIGRSMMLQERASKKEYEESQTGFYLKAYIPYEIINREIEENITYKKIEKELKKFSFIELFKPKKTDDRFQSLSYLREYFKENIITEFDFLKDSTQIEMLFLKENEYIEDNLKRELLNNTIFPKAFAELLWAIRSYLINRQWKSEYEKEIFDFSKHKFILQFKFEPKNVEKYIKEGRGKLFSKNTANNEDPKYKRALEILFGNSSSYLNDEKE